MATPSLQVLTNTSLLKHITAFELGIPWPLYEFWRARTGQGCYLGVVNAFRATDDVVVAIVRHGAVRLLDLATRVQLPYYFRNVLGGIADPRPRIATLNLHAVVRLAIEFHRPEALQWGIVYQREHAHIWRPSCDRLDPEDLWRYVVRGYRDGDALMLRVLRRELAMDTQAVQAVLTRQFVERHVKTVEFARVLLTEFPELQLEQKLLASAALRGDIDMVTCLQERGGCGRCDPHIFELVCYNRHDTIVTFLLEHNLVDMDPDDVVAMVAGHCESTQQLIRNWVAAFPARK